MYDLVAIGSGIAGGTPALRCAEEGWKVAVIDHQEFGGTCALRGCSPKKALVSVSEAKDFPERMHENGVEGDIRLNWARAMAFKEAFTESVPESTKKLYRDAGIVNFEGTARFLGEDSLSVNDIELRSKCFLIGSGAKPRPMKIDGSHLLTTSDEFLNLRDLPKSVIFVGGGYISFEFAHLAARAGAEVKILHRSSRVLKHLEPDLVDELVEASRDAGIQIITDTEVEKILEGLAVVARDGQEFKADLVVHGAGRIPQIQELQLDKAGVRWSEKGVLVNGYLQSSNPRIYAAGDCCAAGLPLTPVARVQARAVSENMLKGNMVKMDYEVTPNVLFTVPPLAKVGMTERELKEKGRKFDIYRADSSSWNTMRRVGIKHAGYKILVDPETGKILGAHVLGHHAEEVINIFALAMRMGTTEDELMSIPWTFPTSSSDIPDMFESG